MRRLATVAWGLWAASSCAGPAGSGPTMQPSPDRNPSSDAAAAMAPSQPIQQQPWMAIGPPPQTTTQEQRARVEVLLSQASAAPPSEQLLAQGPGVYSALAAIFHDPEAPLPTRARALESMANLQDSRGFAVLHEVLASPSSKPPSPFFAHTAIRVLVRAQGTAAVRSISDAFAWKDPTVRIEGAEALGRIGGPEAHTALQRQLELESDPGVRAALEQALAKATP
ncbi:MAG: HEAT repeat domain-containing protein [Myxococcales bacterium]